MFAHIDALVHQVLVGRLELFPLVGLPGKGLDHPHPGQVLLQHRIEMGQVLLHLSEQRAQPGGKVDKDGHRQGHEDHHDQSQLPVEGKEQDQAADDHDQGRDEHDEPPPHEHLYPVHVAGSSGQQLAGLGPVVVAKR